MSRSIQSRGNSGKAFDSLKYAQDGNEIGDRYLPPSGVVIPPLV